MASHGGDSKGESVRKALFFPPPIWSPRGRAARNVHSVHDDEVSVRAMPQRETALSPAQRVPLEMPVLPGWRRQSTTWQLP